MPTVEINGVTIEIPRHVKKPGAWKSVETEQELRAALADGWVLRLDAPPPTVAPTTPAEAYAPVFPDVTGEVSGEGSDDGADEAPKRGPGRPKKR
jgi:hypothetical protein